MNYCCLCDCGDTEENPLLEMCDDDGFIVQHICLNCYVEDSYDKN